MRGLAAFGLLVAAYAACGQEPATGSSSAAATSPDLTPTPSPAPGTAAGTPGTAAPTIGAGSGSLADIAKKQKEKREQEGKRPSLGVISNQTLKKGAATEATGKGDAKGKPTPTPGAVSIPEFRDLKGRSEAEWRRMMAAARGRVTATEAKVASLESETKKLENDFYAWSDGNYRDRVIRPAWDQARAELGKARKELDDARTQITDLEEEARRTGAPPGWLR